MSQVEKCLSGNVLWSRNVSDKKWGSRNVAREMSGRDSSLHENKGYPHLSPFLVTIIIENPYFSSKSSNLKTFSLKKTQAICSKTQGICSKTQGSGTLGPSQVPN